MGENCRDAFKLKNIISDHMKFRIEIPMSERLSWIIIPIIFSCFLVLIFLNAKDSLSQIWFTISVGIIVFVLFISIILLFSQFISYYIEIRKDGLFVRYEGNKFIPYSNLIKIVISQYPKKKILHKIILKNEKNLYINRELENIGIFIMKLEKDIQISIEKNKY